MTFVPRILRPLDRVRAGVSRLGLHPVPVTLKSWVWTSADGSHRLGTGVPNPRADLLIGSKDSGGTVRPPHVRGDSGNSDVTIDFLTPAFYDGAGVRLGGFLATELSPADAPGLEYLYQLAWAQGPRFYVLGSRGIETSRSMHFTLHLQATDRKTPW